MGIASALLTLGLMSSSSLAADILEPIAPVEPVVVEATTFSWTGLYAGVNAGWGFAGDIEFQGGDHHSSDDVLQRSFSFLSTRDEFDLSGPFAGAQIGANYQTGILVLGIEGDLQWSGIDDDDSGNAAFGSDDEVAVDGSGL